MLPCCSSIRAPPGSQNSIQAMSGQFSSLDKPLVYPSRPSAHDRTLTVALQLSQKKDLVTLIINLVVCLLSSKLNSRNKVVYLKLKRTPRPLLLPPLSTMLPSLVARFSCLFLFLLPFAIDFGYSSPIVRLLAF